MKKILKITKTAKKSSWNIYNSIFYFILGSTPLTRDGTCSKLYLVGKIWGRNVWWTTSISQFIRISWKSSKKIKKGVSSITEPFGTSQKTEHGLDSVSFTLTVWALANKYLVHHFSPISSERNRFSFAKILEYHKVSNALNKSINTTPLVYCYQNFCESYLRTKMWLALALSSDFFYNRTANSNETNSSLNILVIVYSLLIPEI